jgi:gliding motility-associated-like protein
VNAPIQASFAAVGPFCSGSNFTLPATSNEGFTGSWSPAVDNQNTTSYTFTVDAGQCAQNGTLSVAISTNPTIDVTGALLSNENCNQQDGSISGITITGGTPAYNYEWNNNGTLNTLDLQGLSAGNYDLTVTDQLGCTATISLLLEEIQAPIIDVSNLMVVQPTCLALGSIDGLQVTGNSPFTHNWTNTSQTSLSINNLIDGTYNLTVEDQNGCTSVYGPIVMTTPNGPTASFTWSPQELYAGEESMFTNNSSAVTNFTSSWSLDGNTFNTTNLNYIFQNNGTYEVVLSVVDLNGCQDSMSISIMVLGELIIPNVLTLNGDGDNEVFIIDGLKENSTFVVLNRWGNVVYESDNYQNDWNGTNKDSGVRLPDGVYTYLLRMTDGEKKHGFLHIVH